MILYKYYETRGRGPTFSANRDKNCMHARMIVSPPIQANTMALTIVRPFVLLLMTIAETTKAARYSTTIIPEPTYMDMAIVVLPVESNATVSVQCFAYQDGGLRDTVWYIERVGENFQALKSVDNGGVAVFGGATRNIVTIVNATQDMHRAVILCGPSVDQLSRRFLLTFPGKLASNFSLSSCTIYIYIYINKYIYIFLQLIRSSTPPALCLLWRATR